MYKLLVFACMLAVALAAPQSGLFYSAAYTAPLSAPYTAPFAYSGFSAPAPVSYAAYSTPYAVSSAYSYGVSSPYALAYYYK